MSLNLNDFEYLHQNLNTAGLFGSDCALANVYLLEPKYQTQVKIQDNIFFRHYFGTENRYGYAFPLPVGNQADYLKHALELIFQANKNPEDIHFCLCSQEQKADLDELFRTSFSSYKIDWNTTRNDSDYIYLREKLVNLSGNTLQKKKNHVSRFMRTYEGQWEYKSFPQNDIAADILQVEETWYHERSNDVEKAFDDHSLSLERESIKIALENAKTFGLTGGVIYLSGRPVAMCLASSISPDVIDVHFEKVIAEVAQNGGYAAINNLFARNSTQYLYINREEDMGVEGLRHAKLSYKPEIILDKFYGKVVKL